MPEEFDGGVEFLGKPYSELACLKGFPPQFSSRCLFSEHWTSDAVQTTQLDGPIDFLEPLSAKCRVFRFDHFGKIYKTLDVSFHTPDGIELSVKGMIDWPKLFQEVQVLAKSIFELFRQSGLRAIHR